MEWVTSMGSEDRSTQTDTVPVDELLQIIRTNAQITLDLVLKLCAEKNEAK
jgi:hypothetical protein